ncbi:MAG: hypothetical protein WC712_02000 [Candidatus Brocadiia bacterium]
MLQPGPTVHSRPSLVHILLKAAVIFMLIEAATFGLLISAYRITAAEMAAGPRPLQWVDDRIAGRNLTISIALAVSAIALILFTLWLVKALVTRSQRPLVIGLASLIVPGSRREIPFSEIAAVVVWSEFPPGDSTIFEGLCAPEVNARGSSIETVVFLDKPVAIDALAGIEPGDCDRSRLLRGFYRHSDNEELLSELARRLTQSNPAARVYTIVSKFARQRVIWRPSAQ